VVGLNHLRDPGDHRFLVTAAHARRLEHQRDAGSERANDDTRAARRAREVVEREPQRERARRPDQWLEQRDHHAHENRRREQEANEDEHHPPNAPNTRG